MNSKEFKALAKSIKFPGGANTSFDEVISRPGEFIMRWWKDGGHSGGKKVSEVARAACSVGFLPSKRTSGNTPDGSTVGSGSEYVLLKDGKVIAKLWVNSSYGVTAYENSYSIRLQTIVE